MLLLLLTIACGPTEEPEPIDARAATTRVEEVLQDAARLDADGQTDDAILEWARGAHRFEHELEPWLRERADPLEVAKMEYRLSLMRNELGTRRGKPATELAVLMGQIEPYLPEADPALDGAVLAEPQQ